jgi:Fur family zinc uptake transcriptional regulator
MTPTPKPVTTAASHTHEALSPEHIAECTLAVEKACAQRSVRLTPTRRAAYQVMLEHGTPISAYELLDRLQARLARRLAPPTVYRALDFLLGEGFVHRIESRNAYVPCDHPGDHHESVYFICSVCGASQEGNGGRVRSQLTDQAERLGFVADRQVIEVHGRCRACVDQG